MKNPYRKYSPKASYRPLFNVGKQRKTVCTRMSSVYRSYVLVCHPYVTRMYLCHTYDTRMASVCHSYVLVCHPYVTRMYSYSIRVSLVCGFTINLDTSTYINFDVENIGKNPQFSIHDHVGISKYNSLFAKVSTSNQS